MKQYLNFLEPIPGADDRHLNLFGGPDETAERERIYYTEAMPKYPINKLTTCNDLSVMIEQCNEDVQKMMRQRAAGGTTDRVVARYQDAYDRRLTELKQAYAGAQCEVLKDKAEKAEFFDTQLNQLGRVKSLSANTDKLSTYVMIGLLLMVVGVSGIVIVKKLKSQ